MNGDRLPGREWHPRIAKALGDEIYDILGLERPDPMLRAIEERWENLSPATKKRIQQILDEQEAKQQQPATGKPAHATE